ncbi:universal stress protein [Rhodoferax sp. U2-2l]|uniref:universal stress protein n=1 Tax=Rhodoferax sp. U2-2l TaxID=2884000 RepID=UPI001D0A1D5A|nr:universal stress protein [Rhodoferax sp. U2-2l]MCB8745777.1 universal stress protein [Rhodoferax sp. U2-2l]
MSTSYLIAVDGSDPALRAVDHVVQDAANRRTTAQIYLVNVQPPLPNDVTRFIDNQTVEAFHRESGDAALAGARQKLTQAGMAFTSHLLIGDAAPAIVNFANEKGCSMIVMGAHGFGHVVGLFMGSVTVKVVQLSTVPVLLIK